MGPSRSEIYNMSSTVIAGGLFFVGLLQLITFFWSVSFKSTIKEINDELKLKQDKTACTGIREDRDKIQKLERKLNSKNKL